MSQDLGSRLSFATTNMIRAWANPFLSEIVPALFCALTASWGRPCPPRFCRDWDQWLTRPSGLYASEIKVIPTRAHYYLRTPRFRLLCLPPHITLQSFQFLAPTASSLGKYPPINEATRTKLKNSSTSFPCPNRSIHSFIFRSQTFQERTHFSGTFQLCFCK